MDDTSSVDASLWWDPFTLILTELENSSMSSDLPPNLAKKLNDNHAWFVDTLLCFKPPHKSSMEALNSKTVKIGSHQLNIQPHLKDKALQISSCLLLDEVQSYIIVERSIKHNAAANSMSPEFLHLANTCSSMHHCRCILLIGSQRLGELSSKNAPLLCPPTVKEDFEICSKPSFVNSRNGWFALSPLGCVPKQKISSFSTAFSTYGQATEITDPVPKTHFSDTVALQVYRIAFLLLKFLCLQTEGAAKRAEEVGFVDLGHFPELPMPEIFHGLQDQAIAITRELCEANKLKVSPETQDVCNLLLQILEMALHLELCVVQICGIRPVLGRVEDFSKEAKSLFSALEGHAFLKASCNSLKQMISCVYPGLLQERISYNT